MDDQGKLELKKEQKEAEEEYCSKGITCDSCPLVEHIHCPLEGQHL